MKTVALYGGSFDPPHVAHVLSVAWVLSALPVDAAWVLPVWRHRLGKTHAAPFAERMTLCRLAFSLFGDRVQVRDDEARPEASGATIDLVRHLQLLHPDVQFRLVIGSDILHQRALWQQFEELMSVAPLIVLPRPGFEVDPAFADASAPLLLPDVSSTWLRAALPVGANVAGLLPRPVAAHIAERGLYGRG